MVTAAAVGHCCGVGSIPGPGTSTCRGGSQKKKNVLGVEWAASWSQGSCIHDARLERLELGCIISGQEYSRECLASDRCLGQITLKGSVKS